MAETRIQRREGPKRVKVAMHRFTWGVDFIGHRADAHDQLQ